MPILSSILRANFRRTFIVIYLLSSALPILLMIFIVFRYIAPQLAESQLYTLNPVFGLGVLIMLIPSILGIGLGYHWIGSIEKLASEIQMKSKQIRGEIPQLSKDQSELAAIHELFNGIHSEFKKNIHKLDDLTKQLLSLNLKLEKMATRDSLTSLYNRRYFDLRLIEEATRADRDQVDLALIMIDFDDFKRYNDSYGHKTGDKLLQDVAAIINKSVRRSDTAFRYGGDEFAVLLPGCSVGIAERKAKRFVAQISDTQFSNPDGKTLEGITISCGIAAYQGQLDTFMSAADSCLLAAKAAGKDRVVVS